MANFPLAFWKNDLQGVGTNKTYFRTGEGKRQADGLGSHRHSRKSGRQAPLMEVSLQNPGQRAPKIFTAFKQKVVFCVQKRHIFGGGHWEEGKEGRSSIHRHHFIASFSPPFLPSVFILHHFVKRILKRIF